MVISMIRQTILCLIEGVNSNIRCFYSFVYAANGGTERRQLWRYLRAAKAVIQDNPWMLIGDFNVTLKINEHSTGSSTTTNDMQDFLDYVNDIEFEDIYSACLFYLVKISS